MTFSSIKWAVQVSRFFQDFSTAIWTLPLKGKGCKQYRSRRHHLSRLKLSLVTKINSSAQCLSKRHLPPPPNLPHSPCGANHSLNFSLFISVWRVSDRKMFIIDCFGRFQYSFLIAKMTIKPVHTLKQLVWDTAGQILKIVITHKDINPISPYHVSNPMISDHCRFIY